MICRDPELVEQVQGAAAAMRLRVLVTREAAQVRAQWRDAPTVVIGVDSAAWVAGLGLPARPAVHVVGRSAEEVMAWSVPLEAAVLVLPDQAGFISTVLDQTHSGQGGALLRVVGASGGLGTSTLAAGLALVAGQRGPAALVELAPCGGGLDVLLGLERDPGWRWDDLAAASGHLGDLGARVPSHDQVVVVSSGRAGRQPSAEAAGAVLRALLRSHPLVVADVGRGEEAVGERWAQARTILLVGADVRGVLAARALTQARGLTDVDVVVRVGPGRSLDPADVEASLGLRVVGSLGHHRGLPDAQAQGIPPVVRERRFAKECRRLLEAVTA